MDAALRAIAEPHRREIIRLVWSGELPAGARREAWGLFCHAVFASNEFLMRF